MCLFLDAAKAWTALADTSYKIVIGHKSKMRELNIVFQAVDFDHLSGIQYANDVDFRLHRNEYRGEKLIPMLLNGRISALTIEKSALYLDRIRPRLEVIIQLRQILNTDFSIYEFSPHKLPFHSEIKAAYVLYNETFQNGVFLFVDVDDRILYCKSTVHYSENSDYTKNQIRWTILQKIVTVAGIPTLLFEHSSFKKEGLSSDQHDANRLALMAQ